MSVLRFLFPDRCIFCGRVLSSGHVCETCARDLPRTEGGHALRKGEFFDLCVSPFYYRGRVRDSILMNKFGGRQSFAAVWADYCARCVREHLQGGFDIITWVPVSRKRLRKRGYDQAELLAGALADVLGADCVRTLIKVRDNPKQSTITDDAGRRANVSGAYKVSGADIAGKRVLLVDDLITTGATMNECARTLLMAGAEQVLGCTFARAK